MASRTFSYMFFDCRYCFCLSCCERPLMYFRCWKHDQCKQSHKLWDESIGKARCRKTARRVWRGGNWNRKQWESDWGPVRKFWNYHRTLQSTRLFPTLPARGWRWNSSGLLNLSPPLSVFPKLQWAPPESPHHEEEEHWTCQFYARSSRRILPSP